jgi:hypothetical protein
VYLAAHRRKSPLGFGGRSGGTAASAPHRIGIEVVMYEDDDVVGKGR